MALFQHFSTQVVHNLKHVISPVVRIDELGELQVKHLAELASSSRLIQLTKKTELNLRERYPPKASKMNMNNLLNEENDGYAWEGDYEQTW